MDTPPTSPSAQFSRQCLEALKSIGKTLGQMTLYKVGHPAVEATLALAERHLNEALAQTQGELSFSVDQQQWIANGRIVGTVAQTPNAVLAFFNRFKLSSLTFKSGLSHAELSAFCELAAMREGALEAADPQAFFEGRSVTHVQLSEAVYTKTDGATPPSEPGPGDAGAGAGVGAGAGAGAGGDAAAEEADRSLFAALETPTVEGAIQTLVGKAVVDPGNRAKAYEKVMALLQQDIQKRVDEVTKTLRHEKTTLQNEQTRTQTVLGNMVEGVVVVDEQGKILMMNPAAEQIYGQTLAQSAGKGIAEKASEQFIVTMASDLTSPADRDIGTEVKLQGDADTQRTLRASSAIVKTEEGKVVGMVSALPDQTKHKELQRMQRDFVAHVTHELRAPLSSIRAALEILQGQFANKIEEDETRMLNTALKNSDRLADMINSILDFSKIESGQMEVFTKPSDAAKIAQDAVDSLQPWAQKKRIELTLSTPEGLPVVEADAARTVQVIINLLSNAIKFTPAGGKITVKLAKRAEGNQGFVEFSVTDTGPGIAKEEQGKIFEKFVQIAAGETHIGGTGLGLSIAKALVHLQKGKMWIESEPRPGATFLFPWVLSRPRRASYVRTKAPW